MVVQNQKFKPHLAQDRSTDLQQGVVTDDEERVGRNLCTTSYTCSLHTSSSATCRVSKSSVFHCDCKYSVCHMHSSKKQKVVSFYGKATPRPTVLLDKNHEPVRDRVDAPEPVTGALIGIAPGRLQDTLSCNKLFEVCLPASEWAKAVPESRGGARPVFKNAPRACLTAFGALVSRTSAYWYRLRCSNLISNDHCCNRGRRFTFNVTMHATCTGTTETQGTATRRYAQLLQR